MTKSQKEELLINSYSSLELARMFLDMEESKNEYLLASQTMWMPFLRGGNVTDDTPKEVAKFIEQKIVNGS